MEHVQAVSDNNISPNDLLQYLLERCSILREDTPGSLDFIHKSFQEYFAAKHIVEFQSYNFLIDQLEKEQWSEIIQLTVGLSGAKMANDLIREILRRAELKPNREVYLHVLSMRCSEMLPQLDPSLKQLILSKLRKYFPPIDADRVHVISLAGNLALPFLSKKPSQNLNIDLYSILTLIKINSPDAYKLLLGYLEPDGRSKYNIVLNRLLKRMDKDTVIGSGILDIMIEKGIQYYRTFVIARVVHAAYHKELLKNRKLIKIEELDVSGKFKEESLDSFLPFQNIRSLDISDTPVKNIEAIKGLPLLTHFRAEKSKIFDISPLRYLKKITRLSLGYTDVWGIAALKTDSYKENLQELDLKFTKVDSFKTIEDLKNLRVLDLEGTSFSDTRLLSSLNELRTVNLRQTKVTDIRVLENCEKLKIIYLGKRKQG